jgi:hypothetical protein
MALGVVVVVCVVRQRRRSEPLDPAEHRTIGRALFTSAAVLFVVWLPPVIEELTSSRGNFSDLAGFFTRPGSPHTLSEGLEHAGLQATLMVRGVFAQVSLMADGHQAFTLALVVSAIAFALAIVAAVRARAANTVVLLVLVALELLVGVYGVTKIVGPIQYYLVQWISAVGFLLWLAVGQAALELVRARRPRPTWFPTARRVAWVVVLVALCGLTIRALPGHAGLINENLDVPNNRALFGYVPTKQLLGAIEPGRTVVLRNDTPTAWEVLGADALMLEQHGRRVQIVETQETGLLFDDAILVDAAPRDALVLSFRDRGRARLQPDEMVIAHQGKWSIVLVSPG